MTASRSARRAERSSRIPSVSATWAATSLEWIQDFYVPDITENVKLVEDPLGPETGQLHVVRGAGWRSATVQDLRMAARSYGTDAREDIGFRIARNLE